jgi:hypothetical protein
VRLKWFLSLWYVWRKPCTYLALRLTLSPNGLKWHSTWPTSPRGSIRCIQNDLCPMVRLVNNRAPILHWRNHYHQMDRNEIPHDQCHLGGPSGVSKRISEPMVRSAQIVQLSCVKISTIFEQTKTSTHLSLVTKEYHRVLLKWFLSLWYHRRKPCSYLASRLAQSPNRPKWASTWVSSPRSTIGCVQNDLWAYGTFGANRAPILHWAITVFKSTEMTFHMTNVT